jgi:hypothetical protein
MGWSGGELGATIERVRIGTTVSLYHGAYIREGGNAASGALRTAQKQGARLWELRAATNMAASGAIKASAPTPAT